MSDPRQRQPHVNVALSNPADPEARRPDDTLRPLGVESPVEVVELMTENLGYEAGSLDAPTTTVSIVGLKDQTVWTTDVAPVKAGE